MLDSCVFYKSFYLAIKSLDDKEQLEMYQNIFSYVFEEKEPLFESKVANAMFILIKPNIDCMVTRYKTNKANGLKGGAPKGNQNAKKKNNPKITKKQPNKQPKNNLNKDIDIDKDIDINKDTINNNILKYAEYNWVRTLTGVEITKLQEFEDLYGYDEVKKAIDIACEHNANTIAYVNGVLVKRPKKPVWLEKEYKKEELTNEDKEEMERILEDFK